MSTDYIPKKKTIIANAEIEENVLLPLLPRSAWNSQLAFFRAIFRAKKALDRIEQEFI